MKKSFMEDQIFKRMDLKERCKFPIEKATIEELGKYIRVRLSQEKNNTVKNRLSRSRKGEFDMRFKEISDQMVSITIPEYNLESIEYEYEYRRSRESNI